MMHRAIAIYLVVSIFQSHLQRELSEFALFAAMLENPVLSAQLLPRRRGLVG